MKHNNYSYLAESNEPTPTTGHSTGRLMKSIVVQPGTVCYWKPSKKSASKKKAKARKVSR